MQQLNFHGKDKATLAIEFIRKHEPPEGYFLGFSGGKDSTVLYDLTKKSGVKFQAYYSATGIDAPEVVKFIREKYPDVIHCRPKESFFSLIPKKGYPTKWTRWCCDKIKKENTKHIPLKYRLMGIRAEESSRRANRPMIDVISNSKKIQKLVREFNFDKGQFENIKIFELVSEKSKAYIIYKPIFKWLEWEVWDYIYLHKLPYCSLYDEGFDRLGCVVCPFVGGRKLAMHKARWPKIYAGFERAMKKMWDRGNHGKPWKESTFEEFLNNWYMAN